MIRINNFKEKIYGNMAMVFHRTSVEDLINKVYTSGFKPSSGSLYGEGFYATYDLESQYQNLERSRKLYGNIIVKFAVPIGDFFLFDKEEFLKSPIAKGFSKFSVYDFVRKEPVVNYLSDAGAAEEALKDADYILYQLDYFNLLNLRGVDNFLRDLLNLRDLNNFLRDTMKFKFPVRYTSDLAKLFADEVDSGNKVSGIVFTGRKDGKVLVCYDAKIIMPISYKFDTEENFKKVDKNLDYLKSVVKRKLAPRSDSKESHWIYNADTIHPEFKIDYAVGVIWKSGIWLEGTWKEGIWRKGTWKSGTWKSGTWESGLWKSGTWKSGTWEDGLWKSGTWEDGRWEDGIWEGGEIYNPKTNKYEFSEKNPNETEWSLSYKKA